MPETAQPAPETEEKKSRGLGSYVLWAFVAVMVYVLSSGPMLKCRMKTGAVIDTLYYPPLQWAYNDTPLHKPLGLYWHVWCPGQVNASGEFMK
jgi:hypothetical protein